MLQNRFLTPHAHRKRNPPLSAGFCFWSLMSDSPQLKKWRLAYRYQKKGAASRGIEWRFTFESWLEWWGEDIHRRGPRVNDLCMQRVGDVGPYAEWNVRKGLPLDNARTRSKSVMHNRSLRAAERIRAAELAAPSVPWHEPDDEQESELGYSLNCQTW